MRNKTAKIKPKKENIKVSQNCLIDNKTTCLDKVEAFNFPQASFASFSNPHKDKRR